MDVAKAEVGIKSEASSLKWGWKQKTRSNSEKGNRGVTRGGKGACALDGKFYWDGKFNQ